MINRNKQQSFTLIELLVVIVIIGILAGVIMISTSSSIDKANFAKAQTFSNTVQEELLLNLVSEWTFDNASNIGEDTWGNNNGTINGATFQNNNCVSGSCLSFNASDVNITNAVLNLNDFSISVWAKGSGVIIGSGRNEGWPRYWKLTNTYFSYRPLVGNTTVYSASFTDTNNSYWHYLTVTRKDTTLLIYTDGKKSGQNTSFTNSALITYNDWGQFIGKTKSDVDVHTTTHYFNGLIDEVRIYSASLSSSQIKQNYIAGLNSMLSNGNISNEEYNERINELAYDK